MNDMTTTETAPARKENPVAVFRKELDGMDDQFRAALPAHIPAERFGRVVMTAVQNNPDLLTKCDRRSLWNSAMRAAQDGLLPDGREGAIVIYGSAAQWMPMIGGIRKKVRNSGEIATWDVYVVHARDQFEYELGDDPFIKHRPYLDGDPGEVIAAYSVATLKSGEKSREVMSRAAIEKVRQVSRAKGNGPWVSWYEEMCRKTVARRHAKLLPMSSDLDDLIRRDDELYQFDEAKTDAAATRPRSLANKLDMLAAPAETIEHQPGEAGQSAAEAQQAGNGAAAQPEPKKPAKKPAAPKQQPPQQQEQKAPEADAPQPDQEASQPDAGDEDETRTAPEESSSPASLSDEDKTTLRNYSKALEGAMRPNKLQGVSADFWENEIPDEETPIGNAVTQIYGWHLDRINNAKSQSEIDNLVRGLVQ